MVFCMFVVHWIKIVKIYKENWIFTWNYSISHSAFALSAWSDWSKTSLSVGLLFINILVFFVFIQSCYIWSFNSFQTFLSFLLSHVILSWLIIARYWSLEKENSLSFIGNEQGEIEENLAENDLFLTLLFLITVTDFDYEKRPQQYLVILHICGEFRWKNSNFFDVEQEWKLSNWMSVSNIHEQCDVSVEV